MTHVGGTKRPRRKTDPIIIKRGSASVTLYTGHRIVGGQPYSQFTISYYEPDGRRVRRSFSDLAEARREAELVASKLSRGEISILTLTGKDREQYARAAELLQPLAITLSVAVEDFVAAKQKLPPGISLLTVVEEFTKRQAIVPRSVGEAPALMLQEKRSSGCSEVHLRDLVSRLTRFAKAFPGSIASVSANDVRDYLRDLMRDNGLPVTNRTRKNNQRLIAGLFHFARRQRFVLRDLVEEISELEMPKSEHVEIGVYKPAQILSLLSGSPASLRPILAIGAFCGLRTAELQRLDWKDVKFDERAVIVGADKAKTASRRVVPIPDNCAQWLAPFREAKGRISPAPHDRALNNRLTSLARKLRMTWVRNGLRHSFCSYRLAVTHDPARVAMEAGNSASMIHSHYKALVTEQEGKDWFAVKPHSA